MDSENPNGGTPTGASLQVALQYLAGRQNGRPQAVVLATDGAPNCAAGYNPQACVCTAAAGQSCVDSSQCLDEDGAVASVDALPRVAEAVAGRVPVLVDGGVRRGTDVLTAVALGATAVGIGRPVLWGLAVNGEAGVGSVLDLLTREIELAMALAGVPRIEDAGPDLLA